MFRPLIDISAFAVLAVLLTRPDGELVADEYGTAFFLATSTLGFLRPDIADRWLIHSPLIRRLNNPLKIEAYINALVAALFASRFLWLISKLLLG